MKVVVYLICIVMCNCAMGQAGALFLVAGQSNAVGQGDSLQSAQCDAGSAYEYSFITNALRELKDPVGIAELHFEKAHTGSAWPAFAKAFHQLSGKKVIIIQAARGGSSCHIKAEMNNYGTWDTQGHLPLFDSAIIKAKAAAHNTNMPVAGIIWSQGERDANAINAGQLTITEYKNALESVIKRFRNELGEKIPFYIIQTGHYVNHPVNGFDEVRKSQEEVAGTMKHVFIVYSDTNTFRQKQWMKDEIHYNQTALNDIGKEIANKVFLTNKK
ncbi:sialate O-acetylesterase [Danxiaibacter flavus]|uniref:Sialate O-acetylesterase n=1 Tax=Danxiaibacter flavus TaxID=3049108 RepID=A0ABV3ZJM1_9BACT|nr:sialate O-acetylesterase [Chitinophagaceae bacterium DXS]